MKIDFIFGIRTWQSLYLHVLHAGCEQACADHTVAFFVIFPWMIYNRVSCTRRHFFNSSWGRHQMEVFSALLAICAGNSPHKGQWRGVLMFTFICARIDGWVNNREAGDMRRHRAPYDVIVIRDDRYHSMWSGTSKAWYCKPCYCCRRLLAPILLTWFNLHPSTEKQLHPLWCVGMDK